MRTDFPNLSPLEVVHALTRADAPILLDIRLPEDTEAYPAMIPGAVAVAYDDIDTQLALTRPNGAIVICHKGLKLSAGVTARLLNRGCPAWRISGGQMAWLADGLPVSDTPASLAIALPLDAKVDEVAAAWATLRFAAPKAELLEVPRSDLEGVTDKFNAALPTLQDAPALPGLATLLADVTAPDSLFAAQLAGAGARPSAAFACLDAGYRGRLDAIGQEAALSSVSPKDVGTQQ